MELILAPLRGLTEEPFRTAFSRHFSGVDYAMAPFIATTVGERLRDAHVRDVLPEKQRMPVVPQLLSNNPRDFLVLARKLFDMGYETINWNLGCPYPMVAKKKRGSGLLPYPDMIYDFLAELMPQLPGRLSVKLRLGYFNAVEIEAVAPVLNAFELESVTLHPRIGLQMYTGVADVTAFANATGQINHKMVYNGDIDNAETFGALRQKLPQIKAFMLGRYILANPFLAEELKGASIGEDVRQARFYAFYNDLFNAYQAKIPHPKHLMDRMKAFWFYFAAAYAPESAGKTIKKIQRAQTLNDFCRHAENFLQNPPLRRL